MATGRLGGLLGGGAILEMSAEQGRAALAFTARPDHCHNGGASPGRETGSVCIMSFGSY